MIPPIANRFVAGENIGDALDVAASRNERGLPVILNLLGEHFEDKSVAKSDRDEYIELITAINQRGLDACISIKPTQLGLDISEEVFNGNLEKILEAASEHDTFVWIDMEDHTTTDATVEAYESAVEQFGGQVGICLQANLKRTPQDLERLADKPGKLRLVKGAYKEPKDLAYRSKERVDEAYRSLIEQAFRSCDDGIAIGSHDDKMIKLADELAAETDTTYEIQMLMGVREDLQYALAEEHEVYQYIPFGGRWKSYFYRRLMERKENLLFGIRAILGR